jgi:hypothetical protein
MATRASSWTIFVIAIVTLAVATNAHAADAVTTKRAIDRFHEGQHLLETGKVHLACEAFTESQALDPALGTLLNLAVCHQREGKIASSWREFRTAAALATSRHEGDRSQFATEQADALEPTLPQIVVKVPPGLRSPAVRIDGKEVNEQTWTAETPIDPGDHEIAVSAIGKKNFVTTFTVTASPIVRTVSVPEMEDANPMTPPPIAMKERSEEPAPSNTRRTASFVAGGAAIVALGVGAYFGVSTLSKVKDSDAHCTENMCDSAGLSFRNDAKSTATASDVGFAASVLFAGAAAYLFVTSSPDSKIAVGAAMNNGGAGLRLLGSW